MKRFAFLLLTALFGSPCLAAESSPDWNALHSETKRVLKLSNCSVRTLSLPQITTDANGRRQSVELLMDLDGTNETLCLQPHSLRSPAFKLFVQRGGALVQEEPPLPATA